MSRITRKFIELRKKGGKAFIPYIMTGHPTLQRTGELIRLLEDSGADIIELGVPFSDPLADGPTIQKAAQTALQQGITLRSVIAFVAELRKTTQVPVILMTYYNPVFKYGEERFARDASAAGVDGIIVPDLPPDEAGALISYCRKAGIDTIFLLAPTSTEDRIKKVVQAARGFIYYVSITGITGANLSMDASIGSHIADIKEKCSTPVAVGFGISNPAEAATVAQFADGVIVGSAIVRQAESSDADISRYLLSLRNAVK
ncbi:MAG: tryptophan synthase subunit alpha [Thermodesulfovibrio sp.]|nr:tryptophan synthase subunit alpha [Thermodesulfovibrio sp.]